MLLLNCLAHWLSTITFQRQFASLEQNGERGKQHDLTGSMFEECCSIFGAHLDWLPTIQSTTIPAKECLAATSQVHQRIPTGNYFYLLFVLSISLFAGYSWLQIYLTSLISANLAITGTVVGPVLPTENASVADQHIM